MAPASVGLRLPLLSGIGFSRWGTEISGRVALRAGLWGRAWQLSDRVAGRSVPYDDGGRLGLPAGRAGLRQARSLSLSVLQAVCARCLEGRQKLPDQGGGPDCGESGGLPALSPAVAGWRPGGREV